MPHSWGESRFGYYRPDDPRVIRKHVLMLVNAGVDALIFEVTNGATYDAEREALCTVFEQIRSEGGRTPTAKGSDGREHHPLGFTFRLKSRTIFASFVASHYCRERKRIVPNIIVHDAASRDIS